MSAARAGDARTRAYLFIEEPICWPLEPPDIQQRRAIATGAAANDDTFAGIEGRRCHADVLQLPAIVQFRLPRLRGAVRRYIHDDERMRIHELILRNDSVEGHTPALIVHAGDGVMRVRRDGEHGQGGQRDEEPDAHADSCGYFNEFATDASAAVAHFSSPSWFGEPLIPSAPIVSLPILMGRPPPSGMMSTRNR